MDYRDMTVDELMAAYAAGERDFRRVRLPRGSYLGGANLGGADLYAANLYGADLGGANLGGADLYAANLGGAYLGGADLRGANLGAANLGGAYLGGANLRAANLRAADLSGAYLRGADLGGAYLGGANLGGANLDGANLDGANLDGANLGVANLGVAAIVVHGLDWTVTVYHDEMAIGCQSHSHAAWRDAAPDWIAAMHPNATAFWTAHGPMLLALCDKVAADRAAWDAANPELAAQRDSLTAAAKAVRA